MMSKVQDCIEKHVKLYIKTLFFYVQAYKDVLENEAKSLEVLARIDECTEKMFSSFLLSPNKRRHHRDSLKNQIRICLRNYFFSAKSLLDTRSCLLHLLNVSLNNEEAAKLQQTCMEETISYIQGFEQRAIKDVGEELQFHMHPTHLIKLKELLPQIQQKWREYRGYALGDWKEAVQKRQFSKIPLYRQDLDYAEQKCAHYGFVIDQVSRDLLSFPCCKHEEIFENDQENVKELTIPSIDYKIHVEHLESRKENEPMELPKENEPMELPKENDTMELLKENDTMESPKENETMESLKENEPMESPKENDTMKQPIFVADNENNTKSLPFANNNNGSLVAICDSSITTTISDNCDTSTSIQTVSLNKERELLDEKNIDSVDDNNDQTQDLFVETISSPETKKEPVIIPQKNLQIICPMYQWLCETLTMFNFLATPETLEALDQMGKTLENYCNDEWLQAFVKSVENECFSKVVATISKASKTELPDSICKILHGAKPSVSRNDHKVMNLLMHYTQKHLLMVRGVNDPLDACVRTRSFEKPFSEKKCWNNVCRLACDNDILSGKGRGFSENEIKENCCTRNHLGQNTLFKRIFGADPGCFFIEQFFPAGFDVSSFQKQEKDIVVFFEQPHVTLSNDLLLPGHYVVSKTIVVNEIVSKNDTCECFVTSVRSHLLRQNVPMYGTLEYDYHEMKQHVYGNRKRPNSKIAFAGNSTLFMACSHVKNSNQITEPNCEGFVLVSSSPNVAFESYVVEEHDVYTRSVLKTLPNSNQHNVITIKSLCGDQNSPTQIRGVGFFMMTYIMINYARLHPDGMIMNIKEPPTPSLKDQTFDLSSAFYYATHFGFRMISESMEKVQKNSGLAALKTFYQKNPTVTKSQMKLDGVYPHVRNIVSFLQKDVLNVSNLCGNVDNSNEKGIVQTFLKPTFAIQIYNTQQGYMYRSYPHESELEAIIVKNYENMQ